MPVESGLRIVIIGTSGAGKTTLARRLSMQLRLPHIELDAINWQAGWRDLTRHDPDEFVRRVADAIAAPCWVADGNYGPVREIVWGRATHLVWLDYDLGIVMRRVVARSVYRLLVRTELWAGNRERWMHLFSPDHPIRWAWSTHTKRGIETAEWLAGGAYPNLSVVHLRHPREARNIGQQMFRPLVPALISSPQSPSLQT